jgi:hypothetical protein
VPPPGRKAAQYSRRIGSVPVRRLLLSLEQGMSFTPLIAWTTNGIRMQLEQYASQQNETPERLAGDLLVEALRARHAPPVDFATAPVECKSEWGQADEEEDEDEAHEIQPKTEFGSQAEKRNAADAFVQALLADGPRPATEVKQAALAAGFAWTAINAAAERLNVSKRKAKGEAHGRSWWVLFD